MSMNAFVYLSSQISLLRRGLFRAGLPVKISWRRPGKREKTAARGECRPFPLPIVPRAPSQTHRGPLRRREKPDCNSVILNSFR